MQLDKTVSLLNDFEGRDKLSKSFQFLTRLMKWFYLEKMNQKEDAEKFGNLSNGLRDARKLFSLFKSLSDIQKIIQLLCQNTLYSADYFLNLSIRTATCIQWIYENLSILISIKFIKGDLASLNTKASLFMFISCIFNLFQLIRNMLINHENTIKWIKTNNQDSKKQIDILTKAKNQTIINIIKVLGDTIVSIQGSSIYPKMTGNNISEPLIGLGGMISGVIATYQRY